jgi:IS5 family transposase
MLRPSSRSAENTSEASGRLFTHGLTSPRSDRPRHQTKTHPSVIDGRMTRHPGYAVSQRLRKRVEETFGWMKKVGGFRRTRYRGLAKTPMAGYLVATAYNLVRMSKLGSHAAI